MASGTYPDGRIELGNSLAGLQDQDAAEYRMERRRLDSMIVATGLDGSIAQATSLTSTSDQESVNVREFDKQDGCKVKQTSEDNSKTERGTQLDSATLPTGEYIFYRGVVIIGKAGVGKATIANAIIGEEIFEVLNPVKSMTREAKSVAKSTTVGRYQYRFLLYDTVAQHKSAVQNEPTVRSFFSKLEKEFIKDGFGLLVFVLRYGQESEIECDVFRRIIGRLKKNASECCALVVTGCEFLSTSAKASYLEKLCKNEMTSPVATFMEKDRILLVSLPDMDEFEADMQEIYSTKKEISRNDLRALVHSPEARRLQFPVELFFLELFKKEAKLCNIV